MKKIYYKTLIIFILPALLLTACKEDLPWDEEQYDKYIYVQSGEQNIYPVEYQYDGSAKQKSISFLCSGTKPTDQDITIEIEEDNVLFDLYNKKNFDVDKSKYAHILSIDRYSIPSATTVLKKGELSVQLPIEIDKGGLEGLSPDSTYFIPIAIKSVSGYKINPAKSNLLFRVYVRNAYASVKIFTNYSLKGFRQEEGKAAAAASISKVFFPLSENEVRMFVGIEPWENKLEKINKFSIVIKINEDNTLDYSPFYTKVGGIEIEKLDPPTDPEDPDALYSNTYDPASKRFLMHYRYKLAGTTKWVTMKEIDALSTVLD